MIFKWGKNDTLIVFIIVAIAAFAFYYGSGYLLEPLYEELELTEQTLTEHRLVMAQAERDNQDEDNLRQEAEMVRRSLPTEQAVDQIIDILFSLEEAENVTIDSITLNSMSFVGEEAFYPEGVEAIHYQVSLVSEQRTNLEAYVAALESVDRMVEIAELDMTSQGEAETQAVLIVRAFYNQSILIE